MGSLNIWILVWVIELGICCGLAVWRGGPVERIGAAIIFFGWVLSAMLQHRTGDSPGNGVIFADVATLIAFCFLSARTRKLWTLFAVACQLMGVVSHFASNFSEYGWISYMTALGIWSGDALVLCVISGIVGHQLRKRRDARMEAAGVILPLKRP